MRKKSSFLNINSLTVLALFYLGLLCLRIINGNFFLPDSLEYIEVAKLILQGDFFSTTHDIVTKRPFLYPLFLVFSITFNPYIIVFFQAIILYLTFNVFYKILQFYKIGMGFSVTYFIILTPSIFIYSQLVMAELLVLFLLTVLYYFFTVNFNWSKIKYIQIILVLLVFTKPVFYPFVFLNFILMGYYFYKEKRFNYWVLFPVISVLIFINYNESRFGYKHFSSMENENLIHYNLYYFKSKTESKDEADKWISVVEDQVKDLNFEQKNKLYKKIVKNEISNNFISYSTYHFLTGVRGIVDPGRFDLMSFIDKEDGKQGFLEILNGNKSWKSLLANSKSLVAIVVLIPIFLILILKWILFIRYFLFSKRSFKDYYFLILIVYYVLLTGPVNCSRYMMPLQLIIIIYVLLSLNEYKLNTTR